MYKNFFEGYDAVIFDLDGTIVFDEPVWEESLLNVFSKDIISENPFYGERGQDLRTKISVIVNSNSFRSSISQESYYQLVVNEFFKNIDKVEITSGFIELAEYLKVRNKKLVLVTNSDSFVTNGILDKLGIKKYFDLILTLDDIDFPKPAPHIYQLALLKLKIPKEKVLVFEDSPNGSKASSGAGLNTIILLPDGFKMTDYSSKHRVFIENFEIITEGLHQDADSYLEEFFSK
jgi:HAD superfamily hydrolase (TIGR01509 family)